jgi:ligand-binding sensor domain-containing protein
MINQLLMKTSRLFSILILALTSTTLVIAQPGWTMYNQTNSSLYTTPYTSVDIDKNGKIWVGASYDGIGYFNGSTWKRYTSSSSKLRDDYIKDIQVDNNNKVWIAGLYGLSSFDGTNFVLYDTNNTKALIGGTPYLIGKDNSGTLWIATRNGSFGYKGMTRFDGTNWTTITDLPKNMANEEITDFTVAANGDVWITGNGVAKYSGGTFTYYYSGVSLPKGVTIDKNGIVWVVGFDGIAKYNGSTWTYFDNTKDLNLPSYTYYTAAVIASNNFLLIGSAAGLLKFSTITNSVETIFSTKNAPFERDYCVSDITMDSNGDFWLASCNGVAKMASSVVGIEAEEVITNQLNCFPNPAKDYFQIENSSSSRVELRVIDNLGKTMHQQIIGAKEQYKVNTTDWPSGLYNAVFSGNEQPIKTWKISVQ